MRIDDRERLAVSRDCERLAYNLDAGLRDAATIATAATVLADAGRLLASIAEDTGTRDAETVAKAKTMLRWLRETGDVEVEGESVADLLDGLLRPASAPLTGGKYVEGTWPEHCEQRAFVAGAKWWEFASTGGTMWPSDRDRAEAEAVRRYGPPIPETTAEELRELRRDAARWRAVAEQAYIASIGPRGPYYLSTIDRPFEVCPSVAEFADALVASRSSSATSPETTQEKRDV